MKKLIALGLLTLVAACTGTSTGNPPTQSNVDYSLSQLELMSFRVESSGTAQCDDEYEEGSDKFEPSLDDIEMTLGEDEDVFIIVMKEEVSQEEYPLGEGDREGLEDDTEYLERAHRIAESQLCAIEDVLAVGGTYQESFVLINAFVAQLTVEQAVELARRSDVQSVELANTSTPPPI